MPKKKFPDKPSEIPQPEINPSVDPAEIPIEPVPPEQDPDVIPDDDPYETPPYEIPAPGESP